jgi:hypothetical protein
MREEGGGEMDETNLTIARKVVLYIGLLVAALLFVYPQWRVSINLGGGVPAFEQDIGRGFIVSPPAQITFLNAKFVTRINYVRQFTEVAIALLLTFGLLRALMLKKSAGD